MESCADPTNLNCLTDAGRDVAALMHDHPTDPLIRKAGERLLPSELALMAHCAGYKIEPDDYISRHFMNPLREAGITKAELDHCRSQGSAILLIGEDLERWVDRIKNPAKFYASGRLGDVRVWLVLVEQNPRPRMWSNDFEIRLRRGWSGGEPDGSLTALNAGEPTFITGDFGDESDASAGSEGPDEDSHLRPNLLPPQMEPFIMRGEPMFEDWAPTTRTLFVEPDHGPARLASSTRHGQSVSVRSYEAHREWVAELLTDHKVRPDRLQYINFVDDPARVHTALPLVEGVHPEARGANVLRLSARFHPSLDDIVDRFAERFSDRDLPNLMRDLVFEDTQGLIGLASKAFLERLDDGEYSAETRREFAAKEMPRVPYYFLLGLSKEQIVEERARLREHLRARERYDAQQMRVIRGEQ